MTQRRKKQMDVEQLIRRYLDTCTYQNNLDKKTIKAYKTDLAQFVEFLVDRQLFYEKDCIVDYIHFLNKKEYRIKTVKRKIASLKAFFSYLNYEDYISHNPFSKIKLKIKEPLILPKIIPLDQLDILFWHVYKQKYQINEQSYQYKAVLRDIAVLELLFGTGIRISELCSLKGSDITLNNDAIKIFGKGAKERVIPIFDNNILDALKTYKEVFYQEIKDSGYFFVNKRKKELSPQSVRNMIKKYYEQANIPLHITPHMFRHTFATTLLEVDVDSRHIQQLLGHSSITTTQIYTHLTSNKKAEIMRVKNPRSKLSANEG